MTLLARQVERTICYSRLALFKQIPIYQIKRPGTLKVLGLSFYLV